MFLCTMCLDAAAIVLKERSIEVRLDGYIQDMRCVLCCNIQEQLVLLLPTKQPFGSETSGTGRVELHVGTYQWYS